MTRKTVADAYAEANATERMKELNEAYEVLGDRARRAEYDRIRGYARAGAWRAEREASGPPPPQEGPEPAEAPKTGPAEPSERRSMPVLPGLLGLVVLGVGVGAGAWVGIGAMGQDDPASPEDTSSAPTPNLSEFAKGWWRHGFGMSLDANGVGSASWRVYKWCSDDPSPPCDAVVENRIISGGSATLVFDRVDGVTAFGRVALSSDELTLASGSEVLLTLLPYDMAMLRHNGHETTLCGPDFGHLAPKSVFETYPCGA